MILIRLFLEFLKIGSFSVGGGMATLPFLYDMADKTGWCSHAQIADMLAVSESTPGPIGINMATYVGYSIAGIPGAAAATLGIIIPGILFVILVASLMKKYSSNRYVEGAFYGLRPASTGLIAAAGILVAQITFINPNAGIMLISDNAQTAAEHAGLAAGLLGAFNIKAIILAAVLLLLTRKVKLTKKLHPALFIAFSAIVGIVFSFAEL